MSLIDGVNNSAPKSVESGVTAKADVSTEARTNCLLCRIFSSVKSYTWDSRPVVWLRNEAYTVYEKVCKIFSKVHPQTKANEPLSEAP